MFDSVILLIARSDAYISRSGDFRDDDRHTNRLLYHMGVIMPSLAVAKSGSNGPDGSNGYIATDAHKVCSS